MEKRVFQNLKQKSLDTEIIRKNNTILTQVFTKLKKFPVH